MAQAFLTNTDNKEFIGLVGVSEFTIIDSQ